MLKLILCIILLAISIACLGLIIGYNVYIYSDEEVNPNSIDVFKNAILNYRDNVLSEEGVSSITQSNAYITLFALYILSIFFIAVSISFVAFNIKE